MAKIKSADQASIFDILAKSLEQIDAFCALAATPPRLAELARDAVAQSAPAGCPEPIRLLTIWALIELIRAERRDRARIAERHSAELGAWIDRQPDAQPSFHRSIP